MDLPARRRQAQREQSTSDGGAGSEEAWRAFDTSTEAGRLLRRLYGSQKPEVAYPPVRTAESNLSSRRAFVPGGGKHDTDPREARKQVVQLEVPDPTPMRAPTFHPVDFVPRRRGKDVIDSELQEAEEEALRYRPPHRNASSTDAEKSRLQNRFSMKGGKGLPEELTQPAIEGEIPLHLQMGARGRRRPPAGHARGVGPSKSEEERLFDQVAAEIADREQYLERLRQMGALKQEEERIIRAEIADRVKDMEVLDRRIEAKGKERRAGGGGGGVGRARGAAGAARAPPPARAAAPSRAPAQQRGGLAVGGAVGPFRAPRVVTYSDPDASR